MEVILWLCLTVINSFNAVLLVVSQEEVLIALNAFLTVETFGTTFDVISTWFAMPLIVLVISRDVQFSRLFPEESIFTNFTSVIPIIVDEE